MIHKCRLFLDGQREETRYFFLVADREENNDFMDLDSKLSKDDLHRLELLNSELLEYYFIADIRDYVFRVELKSARKA
jgi:hypothetical protein